MKGNDMPKKYIAFTKVNSITKLVEICCPAHFQMLLQARVESVLKTFQVKVNECESSRISAAKKS